MPKISFRNVKKVYPSGTYALNNINFDIEQGDFVSIIGESGGGKTTLLKLISGLEKATSGEIYFDDEISNFIKVAQRDVAFVFQDYTIYPNMTVFENILMALNKHKISYEAKCEIAWDIIKKMNLEMIHGEVPNSLSFGQCQKVALAKTLVRKPKIVLFDEPLSNIDASAKQEYKKLILNAKEVLPDSTFIYVTHSINDALQLSNKIMVIHDGEILQFDEKQMVFEFPNSTLVADYILEGNQKYRGQIINGFFISDKKEIKLDEFQLSSLHQKNLDNVICYSLGNINVFFDETGQSLTCFKKMLKINSTISDNEIIIFNQKYKLGDLNQAILKRGEVVSVLDSSLFSLENLDNYLEFKGIVSYISQKFLIVKLQNIPIIFKSNKIFDLNDEVSIYYPLEKIKAIDESNNHVIASYIVSNNIISCKVLNSKKGIIKICGEKIVDERFVGLLGNVSVSIPLDAFVINDKGKFLVDYLFNEEDLGDKTLVHFSCKKIGSYLSLLVDNPFKGYQMNKLRFDIDFNKIKIL